MKDYLIKFNSDGRRGTTYADGVHYFVQSDGAVKDGSVKVADLLADGYVFVDQANYNNLLGNNTNGKEYILSGETFVPKLDYVPTEAEEKQAAIATIKAKYQPTLDSLVDARVKAAMLGADTTKIDSQYKTTLASMTAEIKNA